MNTQFLCGCLFWVEGFFFSFPDSPNLTQCVFPQNTGTKENVEIVPLHLSTVSHQNII